MEFNYLVVTNLFRDQLDRYGELATTAEFIKKAIAKNDTLKLVLNADDPLVASFSGTKYAVYYGFNSVKYMENSKHSSGSPAEIFKCSCGNILKYKKTFFAQQGHYFCEKCGFKRPDCDYKANAEIYTKHSIIRLNHNKIEYEFKVNLTGLYNAYNALAAIAFALEIGIEEQVIQEALDSFKSIFGRTEKRVINGHDTVIQLIKNPAGASEVLKTVDLKSNIIVAINDNYADGRDISWLWDSDFEQLKKAEYPIIASGIRAEDTALRLKYAGVPQEKIILEPSIKNAISLASQDTESGRDITILPSYTALLEINKMKLE